MQLPVSYAPGGTTLFSTSVAVVALAVTSLWLLVRWLSARLSARSSNAEKTEGGPD